MSDTPKPRTPPTLVFTNTGMVDVEHLLAEYNSAIAEIQTLRSVLRHILRHELMFITNGGIPQLVAGDPARDYDHRQFLTPEQAVVVTKAFSFTADDYSTSARAEEAGT